MSGTTNGDLERIQFNAISINEFRDVADQSNVELQALRFKWRREVRLQAFGQPRTICMIGFRKSPSRLGPSSLCQFPND